MVRLEALDSSDASEVPEHVFQLLAQCVGAFRQGLEILPAKTRAQKGLTIFHVLWFLFVRHICSLHNRPVVPAKLLR